MAVLDTGVDITIPIFKTIFGRIREKPIVPMELITMGTATSTIAMGGIWAEMGMVLEITIRLEAFSTEHTSRELSLPKKWNWCRRSRTRCENYATQNFDDNGFATTENFMEAMEYAWRNGADIASISLGRNDVCAELEQTAINKAFSAGVL